MKTTSAGILSLRKVESAAENKAEKVVSVGLYDLVLPARMFTVAHKVAELGEVSLTTEFLLRLLYSIDGMAELEIARFFQFKELDMSFVIHEAETRDYVSRIGGKVWLTDAGHALFKNTDKPQIFEVHKRTERVGFDLLSFSPCDRDGFSNFERSMPELEIRDAGRAAKASHEIPDAFRRHFMDITGRKDREASAAVKRSLYSVDAVTPGDRFSSLVPVSVVVNVQRPSEPEPVLDAWKSGHELDDRAAVVNAVAAFLDGLRRITNPEDEHAYEALALLAPDFLKDFLVKEGLSAGRYLRETASRAGDLRADRKTVGIIGSLYSPDNHLRIDEALKYSIQRARSGSSEPLIWTVPESLVWGSSRALRTMLEQLAPGTSDTPAPDPNVSSRAAIALTLRKNCRHIKHVFHKVLQRPDNGSIPSALEMLLIPGRIVCALAHVPIGTGRGFPVPLGILSFDPQIVMRAHAYLAAQLPRCLPIVDSSDSYDLHGVLDWPILPEPAPTQWDTSPPAAE